MFVSERVRCEAPFDAASARLTHLINREALLAPSEAAYNEGLTAALQVGPFGDALGLSKLVRVRLMDPIRRGDTVSVPLRWEATGAAGALFPVLDADLVLARDGDGDQVSLCLTGSYRPPFGRAGAVLDRALLHRVATATIQSLLGSIADTIADPLPQQRPVPAPRAGRGSVSEPQEP